MAHPSWPHAEPLRTARLDLEPLRVGHAPEMARVLADPALYTYTGGSPPSEAKLASRYARQARGMSADGARGWLNWMLRLRSEDRLVGYVQATLRQGEDGLEASLAWLVAVPDQGAGLAGEGAGAVVAWLRTVGVVRFRAYIHAENRASAGVARRIGLVETAIVEDGETRWATP